MRNLVLDPRVLLLDSPTTFHTTHSHSPLAKTVFAYCGCPLVVSGLEDQMLALAVAEERPDLEEAKNQLIISNAKMRQELKEIEDKILHKLSASEGNPVDDVELIQTLEASKHKSNEIKVHCNAPATTTTVYFLYLLCTLDVSLRIL